MEQSCRETVAFEDMTSDESGREPEPFPWLSIKPQHLGINARKGYIDGSIVRGRDGGTEIVRSAAFTEYVKIVEEYTHRKITNPSDILLALDGLLQILERCFKRPMNYGLPEGLLDAAILWRPAQMLTRRPRSEIDIPSWSWAGWVGRIKYEKPYATEISDHGFIKRMPEDFGPGRFRSLLQWYTLRTDELEPLNGNGLGIPLEGSDLPVEWEQTPIGVDPKRSPRPMTAPFLDRRHLVFRTSCTTKLRFGPRIPGNHNDNSNLRALLHYTLVGESSSNVIGNLILDGSGPIIFDPASHAFIVISEAEYFGLGQEKPQMYKNADAQYQLY
jgi:hypothetical protein